jgi:hypothetical protein
MAHDCARKEVSAQDKVRLLLKSFRAALQQGTRFVGQATHTMHRLRYPHLKLTLVFDWLTKGGGAKN